jgi:hypothetical protein
MISALGNLRRNRNHTHRQLDKRARLSARNEKPPQRTGAAKVGGNVMMQE